MDNKINKEYDITYVDSRDVCCNGGDDFGGHPKIYLNIKENFGKVDNDNVNADFMLHDHIECPYCGKIFIYKTK